MGQLDVALAQLAEKLGVGSETFITWLAGDGLDAYAKMKVTASGIDIVTSFIMGLIALRAALWCIKQIKNQISDYCDELLLVVYIIILAIIIIVFMLMILQFVSSITQYVVWSTAPEGMIVQMLIDSFGGA